MLVHSNLYNLPGKPPRLIHPPYYSTANLNSEVGLQAGGGGCASYLDICTEVRELRVANGMDGRW